MQRQEMIEKALALVKDMTLCELLSQNYARDDYVKFSAKTCAYAETFDLADPATLCENRLRGNGWPKTIITVFPEAISA